MLKLVGDLSEISNFVLTAKNLSEEFNIFVYFLKFVINHLLTICDTNVCDTNTTFQLSDKKISTYSKRATNQMENGDEE